MEHVIYEAVNIPIHIIVPRHSSEEMKDMRFGGEEYRKRDAMLYPHRFVASILCVLCVFWLYKYLSLPLWNVLSDKVFAFWHNDLKNNIEAMKEYSAFNTLFWTVASVMKICILYISSFVIVFCPISIAQRLYLFIYKQIRRNCEIELAPISKRDFEEMIDTYKNVESLISFMRDHSKIHKLKIEQDEYGITLSFSYTQNHENLCTDGEKYFYLDRLFTVNEQDLKINAEDIFKENCVDFSYLDEIYKEELKILEKHVEQRKYNSQEY